MKSYAKKLGFLTLAIIICLSCTSVYADDAAYISAIEKMAGLNGKIDCSTNILSYINNNMDYLKSEGGNVASQINISFNLAQFRKNVRAYENNSKQFISLQHLQVIEIYDITYLVNVPCEAILLTDGESKIDYMGLRYGSSNLIEGSLVRQMYAIPIGWTTLNKAKTNDCMFVVFANKYTIETMIKTVRIFYDKDANVRSMPSMDSKVVGVAKAGKEYTYLDEQNNWYKIQLDANTSGWVYSSLATIETRINSAPSMPSNPTAKPTQTPKPIQEPEPTQKVEPIVSIKPINNVDESIYENPILFRNIEWGSSYSDVMNSLPDDTDTYGPYAADSWTCLSDRMYYDSIFSSLYDAELGCYYETTPHANKGLKIAGYDVNAIYHYYLYATDDNGLLIKNAKYASLIYAYYEFWPKDPDAVYSDLVAKLTSIYGDVDYHIKESPYVLYEQNIWYGANGTMVSLVREDAPDGYYHNIYIKYGFKDYDILLKDAYNAVVNEERINAGSDTDGL